MIVLVGLGNPGDKYAGHRHNVGFMAVDAIADKNGFGPARQKFDAEIREGFLDAPSGREKTLMVKPLTYMNESGRTVQKVAQFYKLKPDDFVIFYDELDLAPGKIRAKIGGGAAGHNGIRSITSHIGANFRRIRIGIGHPGDKSRVTNHVLGDFAKADRAWLDPLLAAMAKAAPFLAAGDDNRFATAVAQQLAPARDKAVDKTPDKAGSGEPARPHPEPPHASGDKTNKANPFSEAFDRLLGRKDS